MRWRQICLGVLGLASLASVAVAQSQKPLSAEDTVRAYELAQVSRSAVRDQLALCHEDAEKLDQIYTRLRPGAGADKGDWKDWGELFAKVGGELKNCLRAYGKQMVLHRRDIAVLRDRLPFLKEPKRLTISPKQVGEINAYSAGLEKELVGYADRARGLANTAELSSGRASALLREAGAPNAEMPKGFDEGL
jgi:hypothetical protein